jgi:two-component system, chemotaxis family, protein-glutamate methylesterase/glutaminase
MQNCPYRGPSGFAAFDAVAIATSLGGPPALCTLLGALPADFPAALLVVQHLGRSGDVLQRRLAEVSPLPVLFAEHGRPIEPGKVYLAPPDHHFLVGADRRAIINHEAKVKFCRPAAEVLFTSVSALYRERALGVILTGCNTDGSMGAQTIRWMGGRVLAQDPSTCRAPGMPLAAIRTGAVDFVLPVPKIAAALVSLVMVPGVADYLQVKRSAA